MKQISNLRLSATPLLLALLLAGCSTPQEETSNPWNQRYTDDQRLDYSAMSSSTTRWRLRQT